ncbi:TPA: TIGR03756 family integrating conjugative element protein [Klebsiella quasipneumoniae subsp. quasipneumoniae]|nr:TIGR03756 family integrating conjugative element protein [Klebsiella quasipneumoniae subsp. similipneumoniae]HBR1460304.1 TIGR03756 family integrating conjugative element protein [Klebsiella quasipneumoniae subsp. quasipneumoniae]HBR2034413.1 TIGR03756 family integrating conjugative element protein [Klebsiella quasipneumoniae subsp. quasipneumoniae]
MNKQQTSALLLAFSHSAFALNSATITTAATSAECLEYRIVGLCYWLQCGITGCRVITSEKIRHYIPDALVSAYSNSGENPWVEARLVSPALQNGGDGTTNQAHDNNLSKFKEADVIGHPAGAVFSQFAARFGYTCEGAASPLVPYFLSQMDTVAWRFNLPESAYPESLTPGMREVGSRGNGDLWGNVYPRGGFLHQTDDYRAAAVIAQRAGDIVTRSGQPHVYQPLLATSHAGYWPAGALKESDADSGKWQELTPTLSTTCAIFPHNKPQQQARKGDYAWALWRPYACCPRRGQTFLGSHDI